jgi:hypothetical protein
VSDREGLMDVRGKRFGHGASAKAGRLVVCEKGEMNKEPREARREDQRRM